ncbi:MAG: hypothetical protein WC125_05120 [Bacteroidales bacterium]
MKTVKMTVFSFMKWIGDATITRVSNAPIIRIRLAPVAECCNRYTKNEKLYEKVLPTFENGKVLDILLILNAKWSYECEVIKTVELGESVTFFAQIRHINIAPEIMDLDWFDLRVINPVVYSPNNYFAIGEHLGEIGDYSKNNYP